MAQVALMLAQVCLNLASSSKLAQIGPKISLGSLQQGLLEGAGRVLGGTWSQEALLEAPEVPKWPPGDSKINEKSIKSTSDLRALASE